jgi:UDP:flavonoid glycosyltransferase YjiC (YdhE family)
MELRNRNQDHQSDATVDRGGTRVLFFCSPATGHFHPLLPLARALRGLGAHLAFVSAATMRQAVAAEGFTLLAAGPALEAFAGETFRRQPALAAAPPEESMRVAVPMFADVRVELALPESLAVARAFAPDLIVSEHADFVGPLIAAVLGVAHATLGFGPGHPADWVTLASASVAPHYVKYGVRSSTNAGLYDGLYLDTCPPSLQQPRFVSPPRRQGLRPEPYGQAVTTWSRPDFRTQRPLVLLTMGTLFGKPTIFSTALEGLAGLDVNVLVTVGPGGDPAALDVDPAWVRVERFVPLDRALEDCALVVGHGGAGTTLAALSRGIPMVLLPQSTDQFINSERAVAAGAALSIMPAELGAETLRTAAQQILSGDSHATAARHIREEVEALPDPASVAASLVAGQRMSAASSPPSIG